MSSLFHIDTSKGELATAIADCYKAIRNYNYSSGKEKLSAAQEELQSQFANLHPALPSA